MKMKNKLSIKKVSNIEKETRATKNKNYENTRQYCSGKFNTFTCVLDELHTSALDSVTLVCKDKSTISLSMLWLAALSPCIRDACLLTDLQELQIYLPDIETSDIKQLINILSQDTTDKVISDDGMSCLKKFDGVFWKDFTSNPVFLPGFLTDKLETIEVVTLDPDKVKTEESDLEDSLLKSEEITLKYEIPEEEFESENNLIEDTIITNGANHQEDDAEELHIEKPVKRKKSSKENPVSVKKKYMKKIKLTTVANDFCRKVKPEDIPKDPGFLEAQEKLKKDLLDKTNFEDPRNLWELHHDYRYIRNIKLEKELICPQCDVIFTEQSKWRSFLCHLRNHKYTSLNCACTGAKEDIKTHFQEVHWGWKSCSECPPAKAKLLDASTMKSHMKFHRRKGQDFLVCSHCDRKFTKKQKSQYNKHIIDHFVDNFKCDCDIKFCSRKQKAAHVKLVHQKSGSYLGCDKCSFISNSKEAYDDHMKRHDPAFKQVCDICGFVSNSTEKYAIPNHKATHHDPVLLNCKYCDSKFNAWNMKVHIKTHEQNICNECGVQVKHLKSHMKNIHTPDHLKKFQCNYCAKGFNGEDKLMQHVYSLHTKERPFKCRFGCELGYSDKSNRNSHENKKHGRLYENLRHEPQK